jgi:hypothetical protein
MLPCVYCEEPILPGETYPVERTPNLQNVHRECVIRMFLGSAAHQLKECTCYGGDREDPPGMTRRDAARLAFDTLLAGQPGGEA